MNNHSIPMPTSNNVLDPRHSYRPNTVVSPQAAATRDLSQFSGNYSNFNPYYHSVHSVEDQHLAEKALYQRECHFEQINSTSPPPLAPSAFGNCWSSPHGCHHPHSEMGYSFCVPPPFPHYQYGCCVPQMNDKLPCSKMPSHQTFQKKPHSYTPYRPRRRATKQVNLQGAGESIPPTQAAMVSSGINFGDIPQQESALGNYLATSVTDASGSCDAATGLPPGYKVFNISVEATPSGYQMSAPDGLTLSDEHIENILKVVNTGKPVYTPSNGDGSAEPGENPSVNPKYVATPAPRKADANLNLMAGDAEMIYYEKGSDEVGLQVENSRVQFGSSPVEVMPTSESHHPDTIVIQKSVYCPSNGTIEKMPQEFIQLSSSNLSLYGHNDMVMPAEMEGGNQNLSHTDMQQKEHALQVVSAHENREIHTTRKIQGYSEMQETVLERRPENRDIPVERRQQEVDNEHYMVTASAETEAAPQTVYCYAPETHSRDPGLEDLGQGNIGESSVSGNVGMSQESISGQRESDTSRNVTDTSSEEDIFLSVTDKTVNPPTGDD